MSVVKLIADGFTHRVNECEFSITRQPMFDGSNTIWAWLERWDIKARILATGGDPKSINSVIQQIEDVYSVELGQLGVLHDDGTETAHFLDGNSTIGGIRVVSPPAFTTNRNGEGVTYRTYQVSTEAIVPKRTGTDLKFDLKEKIDFKLGGARFGFLEPNEGLPVKQQLMESAAWFATQSGVITGVEDYLDKPDPIWPDALLSLGVEQKENPRKVGIEDTAFMIYPKSYRYDFGSTTQLIGDPTTW